MIEVIIVIVMIVSMKVIILIVIMVIDLPEGRPQPPAKSIITILWYMLLSNWHACKHSINSKGGHGYI